MEKLWLVEILKEITKLLPPKEGCRHSIILREDTPDPGIGGFLFNIVLDKGHTVYQEIYIEESDLQKSPREVAEAIQRSIEWDG